ncbi:hypothetical protein SAY86_027291 [Trapa natans]|uniref:Uncharacterized protein n=1 Tax=Trapa natans TaxID=22666 RepID=A0AAN7QJ38_TRANT|nr:hypothetical protein SAY86_027291 [Trapa natans]
MSEARRSRIQARDIDPLLKDLNEKKQSFRRNVVSLAAELKEVRCRLASQDQTFAKETITRQEAETKAKGLEEEICRLQLTLEERNGELQASASTAEKYMKELDDLRSQLASTQAGADASAAAAELTRLECLALTKELDEKNRYLKDQEDRVNDLAEQLDHLQKDLLERESSQRQLKDEVLKTGQDSKLAVSRSGVDQDCEIRRILDEVSSNNIDMINKLLDLKDQEIAKLKDEIRVMTAHWKMKTKELDSQLEKQKQADQDLKKRVLKLEFCLQETRSQMRKLQRTGERKEKIIKELRDQLSRKQQQESDGVQEKQKFWETSGFKIAVSMSMLILVVFSKS